MTASPARIHVSLGAARRRSRSPGLQQSVMSGPEEIAVAVSRLRSGGMVAFPTETVYGLGAPALDAAAVDRVFALKGRPANNPLIVHVSGIEMARRVVASWPRDAETLARAFWPGPLTLVLPKAPSVPPVVTAGGPNVAVRCPDHPLTLALLEVLGEPLVGPSANLSGRVSPTAAAHVAESFTPAQVFVLDGGPCRRGIESTVVTLAEPVPRVLRPGVIGAKEITDVLGHEVRGFDGAELPPASPAAPLESPGRLESHYAPLAPAVLVDRAGLESLLRSARGRVAVLAHEPLDIRPPHTLERMPTDASAYAAAIYAALRRADAGSPDVIAVLRPALTGGVDAPVWEAVLDRLRRATSDRGR